MTGTDGTDDDTGTGGEPADASPVAAGNAGEPQPTEAGGEPDAGREPVASVLIPAHDEEAVIGRLLEALTAPGSPPLEVVVACNGCTDRTAEVARGYGATVVEVAEASKIAALNAGDAAATAFPRVYVDADIVIDGRMVADIALALAEPGVHCVAPPLSVDVAGRPWAIRAFYDVWQEVPFIRQRYVGSGVFALSAEGRARFGDWPDVIADDLYCRLSFADGERRTVGSTPFVIQAPHTVQSLVRRRIRIQAGTLQLAGRADLGDLPGRRDAPGPWWHAVRDRPALLPAAVPYAAVNTVAKLAAKRRLRAQQAIAWGRDETTRQPSPSPAGR